MKAGVKRLALWLLLAGSLGISTAYGLLLLLPLYVTRLGGNEADFGVVMSAATISAVLCIGGLILYPDRLRPRIVVALAVLVYALGAGGVALTSRTGLALVGLGVLLGTAWAVVYTATPMVMSELVTDEGRGLYFGFVTGTQQVGIGAGPVIGSALLAAGVSYRVIFFVAVALSLVAVVLFGAIGRAVPDTRALARQNVPAPPPFLPSVRRVMASEAAYVLLMILLTACLFTALTSFQTTFARAYGLNYAIYYGGYTVAVLVARFGLSRALARRDPVLVIAGAVTLMCAAVASFLAVGSNPLIYGLAAGFLGLCYGVAVPLMQARAVNVSDGEVRPRVLPIAGLVFEAAILAFPLLAGALIVGLGYQALFALIVALTIVQAAIAWWRYTAHRRAATARIALTVGG